MTMRESIIAYSIKNGGDWTKTYNDISRKGVLTDEDYAKVYELKCNVVTLIDPHYPEPLKNVRKAPLVIYYYGDISLLNDYSKNVSIVGSRDYSEYGANKTREIAADLAKRGYVIVSGLARGIDALAHQACIDAGGKTVAVLGSGIDKCYPPQNQELYEIIKKDHLVISEIPFDIEPLPYFFPVRNRIIAQVSKTLVLTEAKSQSGSGVTAHLAMQGNTDVMCVPHEAGRDSLCNRLIHYGAALVENANDVEELMSPF